MVSLNNTYKTKAGFFPMLFAILLLASLFGCNLSGSGAVQTVDWQDSGGIDIVYENMGHITVIPAEDTKAVSATFHYTTVKKDGQEFLLELAAIGSGKAEIRKVLFDGQLLLPAAYPGAFELNGRRNLLFGYGKGNFELYAFESQNDTHSLFTADKSWDFTAITQYVTGILYKGENIAWILCPVYNPVRQTLYFTLCYWVENAAKGDYVKIRIYE